jgi:hypothetical protein
MAQAAEMICPQWHFWHAVAVWLEDFHAQLRRKPCACARYPRAPEQRLGRGGVDLVSWLRAGRDEVEVQTNITATCTVCQKEHLAYLSLRVPKYMEYLR